VIPSSLLKTPVAAQLTYSTGPQLNKVVAKKREDCFKIFA